MLGPALVAHRGRATAEQVDKAVAQGATLVTGGTRDGAFYPGTVLTDVTPDMDAYREEFFGPVGVVYKVADEDEAVAIANDTTLRSRLVRLHDRRGAGRARRRQDRGRHGLRQRRARRLARAALRRRQALRHLAARWACWRPTSSSTRSSSAVGALSGRCGFGPRFAGARACRTLEDAVEVCILSPCPRSGPAPLTQVTAEECGHPEASRSLGR